MRPINLQEPIAKQLAWYQVHKYPVFNLAFRSLFLSAGVWFVISIAIWAMVLAGNMSWQSAMPATFWHAHEMIFACCGAVAVGFLLTAAQNWTGASTLNGTPLLMLTTIWLCTRIALVTFDDAVIYAIVGQTLFWLFAICHLASVLTLSQSKNNYIFIYLLSALCVANTSFLVIVMFEVYLLASAFLQLAVLMFTVLIGIVGGRVIPFFTARGLARFEQVKTPKLDKLLLYVSLIGLVGFALAKIALVNLNPGYIIVIAGCLHFYRALRWFDRGIVKQPLLWSLHLAYWCTSIGLVWFGASFIYVAGQSKDALHFITIGGIGLMILAMMARVSLGHTSRPLATHPLINVAFGMCFFAALARAILPYFVSPHAAWLISALIWLVAFSCFCYVYAPILTRPRVDGRQG